MAWPTIRYSTGNENNPADPLGRSELVIRPDGSAWLHHHFAAHGGTRAWAGQVDAAALDELLAALEQAGFPPPPLEPLPPDSTLRYLALEANGAVRRGAVRLHDPSPEAGYAQAFDIINAVIQQLSAHAVNAPTKRGPIVHGAIPIVPER